MPHEIPKPEEMVFLSHFTNTPLSEIFGWRFSDIRFWHNEAVKYYNKLNKPAENG